MTTFTVSEFCSKFNLTNVELNEKIQEGKVKVSFDKFYQAVISVMVEEVSKSDEEILLQCLEALMKNKHAVKIFSLRDETKKAGIKDFDTTFAKLRADYKLDVHLGDPSRMTKEEIEGSYIDPHKQLYIGVSLFIN